MFRRIAADQDAIESLVQTLRTIADPTRLRLLGVLQEGERNVTSLCEELQLPQPTVSHHLGLLRNASIVSNRRAGKQVFYSLNESNVSNIGDHGGVKLATSDLEVQILRTAANIARSAESDQAATSASVEPFEQNAAPDQATRILQPATSSPRTIEQKPVEISPLG